MAKPKKCREVRVHIRSCLMERDLSFMSQIEWENFEFPWLQESFISTIKQKNYRCLVAELDTGILGYIVYGWHKNKYKIFNLAVAKNSQRHGVGTQLVAKLIGRLASSDRDRIIAKIRETNLPALMFFKSCGFHAVRILRNQYDDTIEDAYVMIYLRERDEKEN